MVHTGGVNWKDTSAKEAEGNRQYREVKSWLQVDVHGPWELRETAVKCDLAAAFRE